jgi:hypothetical protein
MNQVNGQSFIAQKLGLKSSQGSESLFGGRVKHLLVGSGYWAGQDGVSAHFWSRLRGKAAWVDRDANDLRKPALAGL